MTIIWKTKSEIQSELLENKKNNVKSERDKKIKDISWMRDRHRDQLDLSLPTTLSNTDYLALLTYIQELRDVSKQNDFPDVVWPSVPNIVGTN